MDICLPVGDFPKSGQSVVKIEYIMIDRNNYENVQKCTILETKKKLIRGQPLLNADALAAIRRIIGPRPSSGLPGMCARL